MKKLCPECKNISEAKHSILNGAIVLSPKLLLYLVGLEFIIVAYILVLGILGNLSRYDSFLGLLILIGGIMFLKDYYNGGTKCPICNVDIMLKLDNPDALKLIKEHDVKVTAMNQNSANNTSGKKFPWRSS